ncbi:helix-turn-helix transcriptional regulator [Halothermothrix orenii]|uniref:Helix-turn-helix type 11 domain protein n=1 Tax=Halothermothrix orenii (strain H 168 / OCM 544 / DSM 9562) TaxID=373903 RepID=B8CYA6_HALOH|nr:WYL domain-containing protein [Halothermothrix orenii]ACL70275.1 Helix-turn-helix type 11 domain protein [Halothermothrix orenii H 168]
MTVKRSKLYRILKMINLLSSGVKRWRARDLAELFGVSPRTIYRDIQYMEQMHIPVIKDEEKNTYAIMEDFYFKPPRMTREEAMALLLVAHAFEDEVYPYREELNNAVSKIINSLPSSVKKVLLDLEDRILFHQGAVVDMTKHRDTINIINDSIASNQSVIINYYSLSSDMLRERKVDPYKIFVQDGAYYLIAYCHLRCNVLLFRVDRIRNIKVTSDKYIIPDDFDVEKYMQNAWGVERGDKEERVVLLFKGTSAKLVKERKWQVKHQIVELGDDKIRFEVTTGSMQEIMGWILQHGSEVEVVRPESLKENVINEIKKMSNIYKKTHV